MRRIVLHIDRLILNNFRYEDRLAIASGLEKELVRVFGDREATKQLRAGGDILRLPLSRVPVGPSTKPQHVGENIARAIGKGTRK